MATPQVASFVDLSLVINKYRQKDPELATALDKIQAYINQTSERLRILEIPIVQNLMDQAAGLPLGYGIITLGNRQVKFEIFDLK